MLIRNRYHVLTKADYLATVQNIAVYILLGKKMAVVMLRRRAGHMPIQHIGNMLEELSQVGVLPRAEKVLLMAAVWKLGGVETPLVFGEDHRMALYLSSLTNVNKFYSETLLMCLKNHVSIVFGECVAFVRKNPDSFWVRWYNRNRLLQSSPSELDFATANCRLSVSKLWIFLVQRVTRREHGLRLSAIILDMDGVIVEFIAGSGARKRL